MKDQVLKLERAESNHAIPDITLASDNNSNPPPLRQLRLSNASDNPSERAIKAINGDIII
jgi:hypothetical protein